MTAADTMALSSGAVAAIAVAGQSLRRLRGGRSEFVDVSFEDWTSHQSQDLNQQ